MEWPFAGKVHRFDDTNHTIPSLNGVAIVEPLRMQLTTLSITKWY